MKTKVLFCNYLTKNALLYLFAVKGIKESAPVKDKAVYFVPPSIEKMLGNAIGDYEKFTKTNKKSTYGKTLYLHEIIENIKDDMPA